MRDAHRALVLAAIVAASLICAVCPRAARADRNPYQQGRWRIAIHGTTTRFTGDRHVVLGGGVSVFVIDGLEIGADVEQWFGDPPISLISPHARYILFSELLAVSPYVGGFYRRWFVGDGKTDLDSVGGRAGVVYHGGGSLYVGLGVIAESFITGCLGRCTIVYPEVSFALMF